MAFQRVKQPEQKGEQSNVQGVFGERVSCALFQSLECAQSRGI